jgi:hypothetical protein
MIGAVQHSTSRISGGCRASRAADRRVDGRWEPREALAGEPQALLVTDAEL